METDFSRFSYSPRIFWFRDILSKNQSLVHAQYLDTVPLRPLALVRPREANPWPSHSSVKRSNWANPAAVISLQNWRHILYLTEQFRDSSMIKDSQFNSSPTPFPNICILFQEFQQRQSGQTYQHNCEGWAYKCPNKARWYRYPTSKTQRRIRLKITVLKK